MGGLQCFIVQGVLETGIDLTGSEHVSVPDSVDLDRTDSDVTISAWMRVDSWDTSWQAFAS